MSTSKLMLCPITSLEKIKTYISWKEYISCKVNVLLPELKDVMMNITVQSKVNVIRGKQTMNVNLKVFVILHQ